jgi:anti-sigma B factor antagonist
VPADDPSITIEPTPNGVRVVGELDLATAPALAAALDPLPAGGGDVEIDLAGVAFVDSSALSVLVGVHHRADAQGRRVRIVHPTPPVRRLLEITSLTALFGLETTQRDGTDGAAAS